MGYLDPLGLEPTSQNGPVALRVLHVWSLASFWESEVSADCTIHVLARMWRQPARAGLFV